MAKVSPFSAFRLEDFPGQQSWISTLFLPLNNVLGDVVQALNGQVTLGDNVPSFTKVLTGSGLRLPLTFRMEGKFTPSMMIVGQALRAGTPITMAGAWSIDGDTITVSELFQITSDGNTALESDVKYTIALKFI